MMVAFNSDDEFQYRRSANSEKCIAAMKAVERRRNAAALGGIVLGCFLGFAAGCLFVYSLFCWFAL